jgi:subtilase family serine protease
MQGRIRSYKRAWARAGVAGLSVAGLAGVLAGVTASGAAVQGAARPVAGPVAAPHPYLVMLSRRPSATPPTTAECEALYGYACYDPAQLEAAYGETSLLAKGDNGRGETIVIVDAFGSPTITADLKTFDAAFKLPAPPKFTIITPEGKIPPWTGSSTQVPWAEETSLDVEYSHAIAPGADILLVETPVAETEGTAGFPQIVAAENYVISHHLGQVISQSFGSTEQLFPKGGILKLRSAFTAAQAAAVTVLAAAGDDGVSDASNLTGTTFYTTKVNSWPSSDPLVTSVGGLHFYLNATGGETQAPAVWNDTALLGQPAAGGGGESSVFARPSFQNSVSSVVGSWRGTPDIAMSASVDGGALVYLSSKIVGAAGFYPIGGTSEASPEFAGIVAIADQVAGKSLGYIDPALYAMEAAKDAGLVDVKTGNNTVSFTQNGKSYTVTGYSAVAGYDMASGLGTVNAAEFVPELVAEVAALRH